MLFGILRFSFCKFFAVQNSIVFTLLLFSSLALSMTSTTIVVGYFVGSGAHLACREAFGWDCRTDSTDIDGVPYLRDYGVFVYTEEYGGETVKLRSNCSHPDTYLFKSCTEYFYYRVDGCPSGYEVDQESEECLPKYSASASEPKPSCNTEGNPCDVITGRKVETDQDVQIGGLSFSRHYDSGTPDPGVLIGAHWRHNFDTRFGIHLPTYATSHLPKASVSSTVYTSEQYPTREAACTSGWEDIKDSFRNGTLATASAYLNASGTCEVIDTNGNVVATIAVGANMGMSAEAVEVMGAIDIHTVTRPSGAYYTFEEVSPDQFQEVNGYPVRLERNGEGWLFYDTDNTIDHFEDGKLLSRTLANGQVLTTTYNGYGQLETVTDSFGNSLQFAYDSNGQIATLTHPGGQIGYGYDASYNLVSVTYEDGSVRQYHYEDSNLPHHLTGITDENGVRYATWSYDSQGRAVSSQHAGNTDTTTFTYNPTSTVVTDAAGGTREYHIVTEGRTLKVSHVTGDKCSDCYRGGMQNRTYDANGFLASSTDWKGNTTNYVHNAKGQELSRTEAVDTPEQRTITTEWHPTFNLPVKITEPERETVITYDGNGNELSRVVSDIAL